MIVCRAVRFVWVTTCLLLVQSLAHADAPKGQLLFVAGGHLKAAPIAGSGPSKQLARLPSTTSAAKRIEVAVGGTAVLVVGTTHATHVANPGKPNQKLTTFACPGTVAMAADGKCVLCASAEGIAIHLLSSGHKVSTMKPGASRAQVGVRSIVIARAGKLVTAGPVAKTLSPHAPSGAWLVSPSGDRAVGIYNGSNVDAIDAFALDGIAVRRRLMSAAVPLGWSSDSKWILVQTAKHAACIVSAVGGQYKCWANHVAESLAPDGAWALVSKHPAADDSKKANGKKKAKERANAGNNASTTAPKPRTIYRGELAGAHPRPPIQVRASVVGPVAWLPTN